MRTLTRYMLSSKFRLHQFIPFIRPRVSKLLASTMSTNSSATDVERLVDVETIGHVLMVAINRPEKRNCVNLLVAQQLTDAIRLFESTSDLYVAVLYGKGGNFCAGFDLSEIPSASTNLEGLQGYEEIDKGRGPLGPTRMMFSKPVIAAVSGYAVAGGLELACMCDLRVLDESAVMGVFCRRFGVPLLDGGTVRLPQMIGLSRALDMILTGRAVGAKEALEMGLANRVVPTGTCVGEATKLAQTLCNFPQECLRRDRLSAFNSCYNATSMNDAFKFEWNNAKHVINQESVTGAQKFVKGIGRSGSFDLKNSKM